MSVWYDRLLFQHKVDVVNFSKDTVKGIQAYAGQQSSQVNPNVPDPRHGQIHHLQQIHTWRRGHGQPIAMVIIHITDYKVSIVNDKKYPCRQQHKRATAQ